MIERWMDVFVRPLYWCMGECEDDAPFGRIWSNRIHTKYRYREMSEILIYRCSVVNTTRFIFYPLWVFLKSMFERLMVNYFLI
jgi:hypothetical protein